MSEVINNTRVSIDAIRRANQKRRGRRAVTSDSAGGSNGEVYVKFSTDSGVRKITLTRDQINAAYNKAVRKNVKKL